MLGWALKTGGAIGLEGNERTQAKMVVTKLPHRLNTAKIPIINSTTVAINALANALTIHLAAV